jgi:two-component system chemotaxis response regulator CheY
MLQKQIIKTIIVDDHQMLIDGIKSLLRKEKHIEFCAECHDGLEAINFIKSNEVDLVITDINMPNMNGLEMLEAIQKDTAINHVPIVMLTTEGAADLLARAKSAGAKGWLVKPFKPEQLIAVVQKLVTA